MIEFGGKPSLGRLRTFKNEVDRRKGIIETPDISSSIPRPLSNIWCLEIRSKGTIPRPNSTAKNLPGHQNQSYQVMRRIFRSNRRTLSMLSVPLVLRTFGEPLWIYVVCGGSGTVPSTLLSRNPEGRNRYSPPGCRDSARSGACSR